MDIKKENNKPKRFLRNASGRNCQNDENQKIQNVLGKLKKKIPMLFCI